MYKITICQSKKDDEDDYLPDMVSFKKRYNCYVKKLKRIHTEDKVVCRVNEIDETNTESHYLKDLTAYKSTRWLQYLYNIKGRMEIIKSKKHIECESNTL